ncbi:hypothetical protein SDC9_98340 [bioreactor metagenome]|jgi:mannose-6-phosphate isomerase|uniref:Mannose-6-phosphate isomerase n=1 Tax=bioreactor metagenome TaxID=1076179 RepID=A0A645AH27_9ZZZZ
MDDSFENNLRQPYFFKPNRVWRLYKGGLLLDRFKNENKGADDHFPEEWLASTVKAYNGENTQSENEGVAEINSDELGFQYFSEFLYNYGEMILGEKHFKKFGPNTAILCKYLDSAVRLPIQCHPDVEIAKKLYNSSFGKTECWHIISTRKINDIKPYILLGFKKGVKKEDFKNAVINQKIDTMIEMLHKIEVKEGETYFVPARMPHAIGSGVFMLEVQEPSDWVVQPEQMCADFILSQSDMWGPLTPEQGLEVFDYTGYTKKELLLKISPSNELLVDSNNLKIQELIGKKHTNSFRLWSAKIKGNTEIQISNSTLIVVLKGEGYLKWNNRNRFIKKSDYFFIPDFLKSIVFQSDENELLEILICMPPEI